MVQGLTSSLCCAILKESKKGYEIAMTMPSYSAIQFHSREEHLASLYDACLLIVNTYNQTDLLDGLCIENYNGNVTAYDFMKYARNVVNEIAEGVI